jgi:hypothetical protein
MRPHERLEVWQTAVDFVVTVYKATEAFPKEERFGLTSQIRGGRLNRGEHCGRCGTRLVTRILLFLIELTGFGKRIGDRTSNRASAFLSERSSV